MKEYPYIKMLGNLKKFMNFIQSAGIPDKLTHQKLTAFGFKSNNDRPIIGILKFIGFISNEGVPQDSWRAYRNKETAGVVLAKAIKEGYSELFNIYPDAYRRDTEAIRNFFTAHTTVGQQVITAMTSTFRTLCELASFDKLEDNVPAHVICVDKNIHPQTTPQVNTPSHNGNGISAIVNQAGNQGVSLNINIELHLPATQDGEVYEKLFQALKKHLLQG